MIQSKSHGDIAEIMLDRAPVNAFNEEFLSAITESHAEAVREGARGIVISGREGMFSGGLDVPELIERSQDEIEQFWASFFSTMTTLLSSPVPVAAAITGHAPAGGSVLALHCDYRVATKGNFKLGLSEVSVGLPVPRNIVYTLQWVVGNRQADALVTAGRLLGPEEALNFGFVDELAEPGGAVQASVGWLNGLLELPPVAMNKTRLTAKSELIDRLSESAAYARIAADAWCSDETQRCLRELVASLKS
jgi:enoyl-CoA hydratase/carnithine racemase